MILHPRSSAIDGFIRRIRSIELMEVYLMSVMRREFRPLSERLYSDLLASQNELYRFGPQRSILSDDRISECASAWLS